MSHLLFRRFLMRNQEFILFGLILGFIQALEILEKPGKFLKPWKSPETPGKAWNFVIKPWKISQNFIEKINSQNSAFC